MANYTWKVSKIIDECTGAPVDWVYVEPSIGSTGTSSVAISVNSATNPNDCLKALLTISTDSGEEQIISVERCCSVLYRWVDDGSNYICDGGAKYQQQKKQTSDDCGTTWTDVSPKETQKGSLIDSCSSDCGCYEPQYRWVEDGTMCDGYDKYKKEKEQRSDDGGSTWTDTGNTRKGSLIEECSADCGCSPGSCIIVGDDTIDSCGGGTKQYTIQIN